MTRRQFPSSTQKCSLRPHFSPKTFGKASSADASKEKDLNTSEILSPFGRTVCAHATPQSAPSRWRLSRPLLACACAPQLSLPCPPCAPSAPQPCDPTAQPPRATRAPSRARPRAPRSPTLANTSPAAARARTSSSPTSWSAPSVPSVLLVPRALSKVGYFRYTRGRETLPDAIELQLVPANAVQSSGGILHGHLLTMLAVCRILGEHVGLR